jgi:hypothetical protein
VPQEIDHAEGRLRRFEGELAHWSREPEGMWSSAIARRSAALFALFGLLPESADALVAAGIRLKISQVRSVEPSFTAITSLTSGYSRTWPRMISRVRSSLKTAS